MALKYKLEYVYDDNNSSDSSVFIHLRNNPPIYQERIDKEEYDILPTEQKHVFLTTIIQIAGVVEISSKAYRLWIMKSPVYNWEEVLNPLLFYLQTYFGETSLESMAGSANVDGTGDQLSSSTQRRKI